MKIIDLVLNDLRQILRDKRSILFLVAMPIVFTTFMGFAYRNSDEDEPLNPRMSLAWVETRPLDGFSRMLYTRLDVSEAVRLLRMDRDAALESLEKGEVDGVLVMPSGFGKRVEDILTGDQSNENLVLQVKLIADPASIEKDTLYQLVRVPISQLMSAVEIGQISVDMLGDPAEFTPAFELAWEAWENKSSQDLVRVEQVKSPETDRRFGGNPYNQASPGMLVQFAIMGLVTSAQILVRERKRRTMQRQMMTAVKSWEILAGHMLAMFVIVIMQTAMLMIFGQLLLGVSYLRQPMSVVLVAVGLGLWVSSMGLLIGLLAKGDEQVVLFALIAMFIFSALGGAWIPLHTTGRVFLTIGKVMPSAWAMIGFQNVLIRGLGLSSAWQPVGILLAYALGFFTITVWHFRKMEV